MTELEKVVKGLECCHVQRNEVPPLCEDCPYMNPMEGTCDALDELLGDALTLLKTQEPRVMTLEEVRLLCKDDIVWYEHKGDFRQPRPRVVEYVFDEYITFTDAGIWSFSADGYGERWRLWTSRPADAQREAVTWE